MFENLRRVDDKKISDMRGLIDPSNLAQFNQFEGGYSIFTVVTIPKVLEKLATSNQISPDGTTTFKNKYGTLIKTYVQILEQEFRGISGLDSISADTGEFTNGLSTINMINKVNEQSAGTFTMNYTEKAGAPITRTHELLLKAIKDTRTGFKHYHGLIAAGEIALNQVGFQSECFSFLYMVTDNTGLRLEKAYYIVGAQPTTAELSDLYNSEKGSYDFKEVSVEFSGFPITGSDIDLKARAYLEALTGYHVNYDDDLVDTSNHVWNKADYGVNGKYKLDSTNFSGYQGVNNDLNANTAATWRSTILGE